MQSDPVWSDKTDGWIHCMELQKSVELATKLIIWSISTAEKLNASMSQKLPKVGFKASKRAMGSIPSPDDHVLDNERILDNEREPSGRLRRSCRPP